jgi:hypothetical protein
VWAASDRRGLRGKLRVTRLARDADGALRCELAPTTWERARGFHLARVEPARDARGAAADMAVDRRGLRRHAARSRARRGAAVVVTSRSQARLAGGVRARSRTSPATGRRPSRSRSSPTDLAGDATLARAVARGAREEFGLELGSESRVTLGRALLELDTLNVAFCALVEVPLRASEVVALWERRRDGARRIGLTFVDAHGGASACAAGAVAPDLAVSGWEVPRTATARGLSGATSEPREAPSAHTGDVSASAAVSLGHARLA